MRVHELAKELGVTSKELLAALGQMGAEGKSASSSVPDDLVPRLRASGGKATATPAKPREVLEPPPHAAQAQARRRSRPPPSRPPRGRRPRRPPPPRPPAPAKPAPKRPERKPEPAAAAPGLQVVVGATPQTLAEKLDRSPAEIVKVLFMAGEMVTATTSLSDDAIELVAAEFGTDGRRSSASQDELKAEDVVDDIDEAALVAAGARRHDHGARRPREDQAPRRDPLHRRRRGRVRRHHPAHRRVPGARGRRARSRSSTRPGTRRSPRCAPAARASPTSPCSSWPPTTA